MPLSYTAHCSITLTDALAVKLSEVDGQPSPNPFHCDYTTPLSAVSNAVHPNRTILGTDPRTYSYFALALYRLLRYLIPDTQAVAATAKLSPSDAPPSAPESDWLLQDAARAPFQARLRQVFPAGQLHVHAASVCESVSGSVRHSSARAPEFTVEKFVQPLLAVDRAEDEQQLSEWQRWLMDNVAWQKMIAALVEYVTAEMTEVLGNKLRDGTWKRSPVACFHEVVLSKDLELAALWSSIGMPADCPSELDVDLPTA